LLRSGPAALAFLSAEAALGQEFGKDLAGKKSVLLGSWSGAVGWCHAKVVHVREAAIVQLIPNMPYKGAHQFE
jgi:hypothetical protein